MPNPSHTGRLVLTPGDARLVPDLPALLATSERSGLIGSPLDTRMDAYLAGDQLLQLISFTGCSPRIRLEPPPGGSGAFCHLQIWGPYPTPRLLWGRNTRPPRCALCRTPIRDWRDHQGTWERAPERPFTCPHCGQDQTPLALAWRENGGFGRFFIAVEDVFPGEAAPVPALMERLAGVTGQPWRYFYIQD